MSNKVIKVGEDGWDTEEALQARIAEANEKTAALEKERFDNIAAYCMKEKHKWEDDHGNTLVEIGDKVMCAYCRSKGVVTVKIEADKPGHPHHTGHQVL